jgi:hypothetical protein
MSFGTHSTCVKQPQPSLEWQQKPKPAKKPCIPFYLVAQKAQDQEKPSWLRKY